MPENKEKIPKIELPMKLKFGEKPETEFLNEDEAIKVIMLDHPKEDFRELCYRQTMSTWKDNPVTDIELMKNKEEVYKTFKEILSFKTLPNSLEGLKFTFLIKGLTHIEISHMLRHRSASSIMALCSGDRDLRFDNVLIPKSIQGTEFENEYKLLSKRAKELYAKMVDSKKISLMDARYILNRNHMYYYYFTFNLKDLIGFINQRKCSQIQPYTDNLIAKGVYDNVCKIIPEFKEIYSLKCDHRCHYVKTANTGKATNLYLPDKTHDIFDWNSENFIYQKQRHEMGIPKTIQDE